MTEHTFGERELERSSEEFSEAARITSKPPYVVRNVAMLRALRYDSKGTADTDPDAEFAVEPIEATDNPALEDWKARGMGGDQNSIRGAQGCGFTGPSWGVTPCGFA